MAQNHVFSYVSSWFGQSKNMLRSCERSWNEDAKIGKGLVFSSITSQENQQNAFIK